MQSRSADRRSAQAKPRRRFKLNRVKAAVELASDSGPISTIGPQSDADELRSLLDNARSAGIVEPGHLDAALVVCSLSRTDPRPLLAVDPGTGPNLHRLSLTLLQREGESPIQFTLSALAQVGKANALTSRYRADKSRSISSP